MDAYEKIKNQIRQVHKDLSRDIAIKEISNIYREVENILHLADARLRISLIGIEKPELGDTPLWAEVPLNKAYCQCRDAIVEDAEKILQALNKVTDELPEAMIQTTDHSMAIDWQVEGKLLWEVQFSKLPWPGVYVRSYYRVPGPEFNFNARTFKTFEELLAHFENFMASSNSVER